MFFFLWCHKFYLIFILSRKLLLSRKRETIYTKSKHGFSLRISKLLSVGGTSLKWSKSIEKNSKRANEVSFALILATDLFLLKDFMVMSDCDLYVRRPWLCFLITVLFPLQEATLAVAAVEKKKRQIRGACVVSGTKSNNQFSRKSVQCNKLRPGRCMSILVWQMSFCLYDKYLNNMIGRFIIQFT